MTTPKLNENRLSELLKLVAAMIGILVSLIALVTGINNILMPKKPAITIENELKLPIIVTINKTHIYRILAGKTQTIKLLSDQEFPAEVEWQVQRNKNSSGVPIGEALGDEIKLVDKGARLKVNNQIKLAIYFYPVVRNNTDSPCTIVVNDGLKIQHVVGVTSPHKLTNITGYYEYASNSNITVRCPNQTYWRGQRIGKKGGGKLNLGIGSGELEIKIP